MIKAVFFDWFDTLAHYDPPRQVLYGRVLGELGIKVPPGELLLAIMSADRYFTEENNRSPIDRRSPQEQAEVYVRYQSLVLTGAGVKADEALMLKILERVQPLLKGLSFVLFEDVIPTLKFLKERLELTMGLLTNASKSIIALQSKLGLEPYLSFVITSQEVGADKPEPPIFLAALKRAMVKAEEAIHVGDHYNVDVAGARGVGIRPILLDRYNLYAETTDCPRIRSLAELVDYVKWANLT